MQAIIRRIPHVTRQHPARVGALLLAVALGLAACGGTSASSSDASDASSASASTEATSSASSAPSGLAIDLGDAAESVSDLTSYQLDITVTAGGTEQVMTIVATTSPVKATHYTMGGLVELISIEGEGAWVKQGDSWTVAPGGEASYLSLFDAMAPDTLIGAYSLGAYGSYFGDEGTEEHNGVQAQHLHLDAADAAALGGAGFPDDGTFDVWIATDGGYLVGMAYAGTDAASGEYGEVSIEVSHVNDASISIEAPI
jgi:hypothetical protein